MFSLDDDEAVEYYHKHYLNQMAIEFACLQINCRNGEITSMAQHNWANVAFDRIERNYYGPSVKYDRDVVHIISNHFALDGHYDLEISLLFKYFDGQTYKVEKRVSIHFERGQLLHRTMRVEDRTERLFESTQDYGFEESGCRSFTYVTFSKDGSEGHVPQL